MNRFNLNLYTTHEQTEQPYTIHDVTALALSGDLLTIEVEVTRQGVSRSELHRYVPGTWTRFTVAAL